MAGEWPVVRLEEVCETITDGAHQSPKDCPGGLPMASVKDMARWGIDVKSSRTISHKDFDDLVRNGCQPQIGDVLIAKDGATCLETVCEFKQPDKIVLLSSIAILRPSRQLHSGYLRYYLDSAETRAMLKAGYVSGSAIPRVVLKDFRRAPILLPPLAEQKAIAHILGTLDDKIELNRRMNATLEAIARALFQSWFVDFDPIRAKLDGRKPADLDAATAALFPAHFQDSPLGHIPQGWGVKTIEELAERVAMGPFGSDIKVSTFVPEGIPVVSGQHLRGTLLDDSEFNFVTEEHADRLKRSNVQRGDVIFTHAGSIGQVAYIPETSRYERYIISQRQFYMRCNRSVMSPFYIASYFKTPEGQHRLLANTSSTGVPSISQPVTYLRQLKMVVPPPDLLKVFDTTVSAIHLKMAHNDQQCRTLAILRDALLPKLLSRELRVSSSSAICV
ncbi:MAG: restriction endonuclease subunit S [Gallionellaceae bacterium]